MKTIRILTAAGLFAFAGIAGAGFADATPTQKQNVTTGCPYLDAIHSGQAYHGTRSANDNDEATRCPALKKRAQANNAGLAI